MPNDTPLHIEVAYAEPGKQRLLAFQVACGTTARQAVLQSALPTEFPHVDFAAAPIGIFGKKVEDSTPLHRRPRGSVPRSAHRPERKPPPQSRCQTEKRGYLKIRQTIFR